MNEKILELRMYLGLSLRAFAGPIGYTASHIMRIEKNIVNLDEHVIRKICEVYRVEPSYFKGELSVEQAVHKDDKKIVKSEAGRRLKIARLEKGLSMLELSRRADISQPQISMLERGKFQLKRKAGAKLAEALDVGVDWLLNGDEGKKLYPADKKLIDWLWEHPEVREELWKKMGEE